MKKSQPNVEKSEKKLKPLKLTKETLANLNMLDLEGVVGGNTSRPLILSNCCEW